MPTFATTSGVKLGLLKLFGEFGIEDGRRDFVVAGGPLAEIDQAAAVRAERDVG